MCLFFGQIRKELITNQRPLKKAAQNYGAMHLSRVGSRGCTGTHTVHRQFYLSLRQSAYLPTHIGAAFADLQPLPDLGVWHTSECKSSMSRYDILVALPLLRDDFPYFYHFIVPILFGTYNTTTATAPEVELSQSLQTAFANFVKDPNVSPAPNWPPYEPGFLVIPLWLKLRTKKTWPLMTSSTLFNPLPR